MVFVLHVLTAMHLIPMTRLTLTASYDISHIVQRIFFPTRLKFQTRSALPVIQKYMASFRQTQPNILPCNVPAAMLPMVRFHAVRNAIKSLMEQLYINASLTV